MESQTLVAMTDLSFRSGGYYTLDELAELARRGLATFEGGISQARAAEILNERYEGQRGAYYQAQISGALSNPERYPSLVLLLVEAFSGYTLNEKPRYLLERKQ